LGKFQGRAMRPIGEATQAAAGVNQTARERDEWEKIGRKDGFYPPKIGKRTSKGTWGNIGMSSRMK